MESGTDHREIQPSMTDRTPRHVMLSSLRGVITEVELVGATSSSGRCYILRYHKASQNADMILDVGSSSDRRSWTGFRYHDSQWSFVKQDRP
ncbi:MAG TPA: hypothetical protein VE422_31520 [Terriglobia bacterium]|nr:hypothetical protein [Terriglobia bacterium]